ncbi:MAG: hypothetical protein H7145_15285 [Akkermansiaceae bacterium]|nr:hypothetical protein [Armatimonadota bacterium]
MSYVGYGEALPSRQGGQIRMEAISEAWGLVRQQMGVWVLAMLLYFVIIMAVSGITSALTGGFSQPAPPPNPTPAYFLSLMSQSAGSSIVNTLLGAYFIAGLFRMALKQIRGESIGVGDLFSGGDVILPMIGANILVALILYAVMIVALVPMFVMVTAKSSLSWIPIVIAVVGIALLNARLFLVAPIVADGRGGALGSIKQSFAVTGGQTLNAFLFTLVLGLVVALGMLLCGVGLLFTFPIYPLAVSIVYRDLLDLDGGMPEPRLDIPLPPPTAYGSTPGQPPPYGQVPGDMQGRGMTMPGTPPPPGQAPPQAPGQMGQIQM